MTQNELTGEQREARRRRRFWLMIAAFLVAGFALGIASGILGGDGTPADPILTLTFIAVATAGMIGISWYFFRSVDELELADNLWAGLIGLYFYFALQPGWFLLEKAELIGPIEPWSIYMATAIFSSLAYGGRKLLNR